jgi:hypothetical protein
MTFDNPEVIELGTAEELIRDEFHQDNTEDTMPSRIKTFSAIYIADGE